MCGHVGIMGKLTTNHEKAFRTLLILDTLRGIDSTGIAAIPRSGEPEVAKQLGDAFQLFEHRSYSNALFGAQRAIIGHNRYATSGKVNRSNAHPFDFDTIVGAHNGTLTTKHKLLDGNSFQVDSEALFNHIDKKGIKDALTVMGGAWALVWWDKVAETMNFLRNKERTLYMTLCAKDEIVMWASEPWMIDVTCSRHNIDRNDIVSFQEDTLFSFPVSSAGVIGKAKVSKAASSYFPPVYPKHPQYVTPVVKPVVNNVVKIEQAKSSPFKISVTRGYSGSKDVTLELMSTHTDKDGGHYYSCFDADFPTASIRLYFNVRDIENSEYFVGKIIKADIGELNITKGYYKVDFSSVDFPEVEDEPEDLYMGHDNKQYDYDTWVRKYGTCCWCGGNVEPTQSHKLTTEGDGICNNCMEEKSYQGYVRTARTFYAN